MLISGLGILAAILGVVYGSNLSSNPELLRYAPLLLIMGGGVCLLATTLFYTSLLMPLAKMEEALVSGLFTLLQQDRLLAFFRFFLFAFPLVSFGIAVLFLMGLPPSVWIFWGWIIGLGMYLDFLRKSWKGTEKFLDPSLLVNEFLHKARWAIQNEKDDQLWNSLDSLGEIAVRAVQKEKISLIGKALDTFPLIVKTFFASSKSIARVNIDENVKQATGRDEASYTLFYLLQRLKLVHEKAVGSGLESVCLHLVRVMGKIIVLCAEFDLSMVALPVRFLSRFGVKAENSRFEDESVLITSTLLEISKKIATDIDIRYGSLEECFRAIVRGMDEMAKAAFRNDKNTNIPLLIQPFLDLKTLFKGEKLAQHRDTPVILQEIEGVLAQFEALNQFMRAIPSPSGMEAILPQEGQTLKEAPPSTNRSDA